MHQHLIYISVYFYYFLLVVSFIVDLYFVSIKVKSIKTHEYNFFLSLKEKVEPCFSRYTIGSFASSAVDNRADSVA